jgi:hypothetical protein
MGRTRTTIHPCTRGVARFVALAALAASLVTLPSAHASALSRGPSNAERRALATSLAHRLFNVARLPAGARRLAHWDSTNGRALLSMGAVPGDPNQVHQTRFYLAPHGQAALAWVEGLSLRGGRRTSYGTGSGPGQPTTHFVAFTFTSSAVLSGPQLEYSMLITPSGELGLRVDAVVVWTPQKPLSAFIAANASRVDVVVNRGYNVKQHRVSVYHVTSGSLIGAFTAHVNALGVATPGVFSCPVDVGATMTLSFFRQATTSPFATVVVDPGGCGSVTITQSRSAGPAAGVAHDAGGARFAAYVAGALSIPDWTGMGRTSG